MVLQWLRLRFFFFNDTATTEIYTLSLHDALPISAGLRLPMRRLSRLQDRAATACCRSAVRPCGDSSERSRSRSEEHTSELQSQSNLVCRLLLEKKKTHDKRTTDDDIPISITNRIS